MCQQVGKVLQFHIDPLLGQCICHAMWAKSKPIVRPTLYPTHTSFIPKHVDVNYSIVRFCVIHFKAISQPAPTLLHSTMGLNIKNNNLSPTPYRVTSFWLHDNPPSYSYERTFLIWPSKSKVKVIAQGHIEGITSYRVISILFHVNPAFPFMRYNYFKNWHWKSKAKWANYHSSAQLQVFHRNKNGENPSSGYKDTGSASRAAARPPGHDDKTHPARRNEGQNERLKHSEEYFDEFCGFLF